MPRDRDAASTLALAEDTLITAARELVRLQERCTDRQTRVRLETVQGFLRRRAMQWGELSRRLSDPYRGTKGA